MSSFSGLGTALSSLIAQRQALEVSGQNIANANTAGYTRQRADLTSVQSMSAPTMFSAGLAAGNGTRVSGITRMGDVFLDARLHAGTATASFTATRAAALSRVETTVDEPSDTGLAAQLQHFWAGWHDVANDPSDPAARQVLLGKAEAVITQVATGYRAVESQWAQTRAETTTLVTQVNTAATAVADLNGQIRAIQVSGGSANELVDQRALLVTELAGLVGATARHREDGSVDVMVAGNALVRSITAHPVEAIGATTMTGAIDGTDPVTIRWAQSTNVIALAGGTVAGKVAALSAGGPAAAAINALNTVATTLADTVNAVHASGLTLTDPPQTGVPFFSFDPGPPTPPALGLRVIGDPRLVAAAGPALGAFDSSVADAIAQLATSTAGPDAAWRTYVVDLGVQTKAATQRATVTEAARSTAQTLQLSQSSVDLDEESINMLAYQRAYEGAARVLTTIDEMLDVLINRTGVVGR